MRGSRPQTTRKRQRDMQRRFEKGRQGERDAEPWLRRRGFKILDTQVSCTSSFLVNGQMREVTVRADMLVARRGKTYVAEVKTGRVAPQPESTATRRQLLEYAHVFDTDGLLLVDMESKQLMAIEFPQDPIAPLPRRARVRSWLVFALGWVLGVFSLTLWLGMGY